MPHYTRLSYASASTALPSTIREHLITLTKDADKHTASGEMAGILIYGNDYFFHCIEAPASCIDKIYEDAIQGTFFKDVKLLKRELINERWFSRWEIKYFLKEERLKQLFLKYQLSEFNPYRLEGALLDECHTLLSEYGKMIPGNHLQHFDNHSQDKEASAKQQLETYYHALAFIAFIVLLFLLCFIFYHCGVFNGQSVKPMS